MKKLFILLAAVLSFNADAQNIPAFKSLRYDEDYTFLKDDSSRNCSQSAKYQVLSKDGKTYNSIGGDIRYQYLRFKNEDWGETPADRDGYLLTRFLIHTDFHAGKYFRTFIQLQSSLANGRQEAPSPVDENQLDLHQAFFDVALPLTTELGATFRLGRQEFLYGSQRLVSVREGPNNRQSFDAAKLIFSGDHWKTDLFYSHAVPSRQKIFDDDFNKNARFWGAYLVKNRIDFFGNLDLYYLGLWKRQALYDDGGGKELRHSAGSRIWNTKNGYRYDIEGVYQFGSLDRKNIVAWTFSINAGYKFRQTKWKPEIGLKTEWISGDASYEDNKLQTFNPLFPRGGYFGLVSLIGPANLFDVHPSAVFDLSEKLFLNLDCDIFWRYSKNDGIYGPNAALIYSGQNSPERYVGRQYSTDLVYTPNHFLYFRAELTWFKAGGFLKDVGAGKDILFTALTAQIKF